MKKVSLLIGSLALLACDGPSASCVRGTTQVCNCTAALTGVQICGDDGTFGACACEGFDAGPIDGGVPNDGSGPLSDAGSDAGMSNPACSCTWGGTLMGGDHTQLTVSGVTDSGDLVYVENPDGPDNRVVQVRGCMGAMQTVRAVDVGSAPGDTSVRAILPGDVLVLHVDPAPDGELEHVVFWDVRTRAVLARVDAWNGGGVHGEADGRGHVLLAYRPDETSEERIEEYDPRGTLLRDVTAQVPDRLAVVEALAEGWLVRSEAGEPQLLLDGSLSPSSRPLPPARNFMGRAGTPFVEGRRFVRTQEIVDSMTVRYHFSEIDLAGAVIWDGAVEMEGMDGRDYGCGAAVMTPTGGWRNCSVWETGALPPLDAPSISTAYLLRFDPETGEWLATIPYATSDTRHCDSVVRLNNVVSDGCGGIYVSMPAPAFTVMQCRGLAPLELESDRRFLIDHYGPDGSRD